MDTHSPQHPRVAPDKIGPDDPRYAYLVRRGYNKRFAGRPDYVRLVGSTEQVVDALQEAVRGNLRVAVRSGGHCLEGFVADPAVRVVIDTSLMTGVSYDPERNALAVEAGSTLGEVYRKLFLGWGVTIPAGESPDLGVGGHVPGGAFGFLCRQHGLAADHLYGVEVVVVDETGKAGSVVATREPSDPNRDLWWAHTGGGGGNFGIVTRCWFRSPDARGTDPSRLLPKAPDSVLTFRAEWNWKDIDEAAFTRLMRNHGDWCERNSGADSPYAKCYSLLLLRHRQYGKLELKGLLTAGAEAERLFDDHLAAINDGVGVPHTRDVERTSWPAFALNPFPELFRAGALGPTGLDSHDVVCGRLDGSAGRSPEPGLGSRVLPGPVRRHRRRARARRRLRRRHDQPPGCRPRRSGVEYLRGPLAHVVLQGQLPPTTAGQGQLGPPQRLPACSVHPRLTIWLDERSYSGLPTVYPPEGLEANHGDNLVAFPLIISKEVAMVP
jgi:hypothetical protein